MKLDNVSNNKRIRNEKESYCYFDSIESAKLNKTKKTEKTGNSTNKKKKGNKSTEDYFV